MRAAARAPDALAQAVARVRAEQLVAYPTETVWGLGADATSERAVARLRNWKGLENPQPISILIPGGEVLAKLGFEIPDSARRLMAALWPGPVTLVLPCRRRFARGIARKDGAVGVRCSPHPVATTLACRVAEAGLGPLTATSLNRHSAPPARCREEAARLCGDGPEQPAILAAVEPDAGGGPPSTVIDLTGDRPHVLRSGALRAEAIHRVLRVTR